MNITTTSTSPWVCDLHGQRLLWRQTTVDCPTCGPLATIPSAPIDVPPTTEGRNSSNDQAMRR